MKKTSANRALARLCMNYQLGHLLRERRGPGRFCGHLGEYSFSGSAMGGAQAGDTVWRGLSALQA